MGRRGGMPLWAWVFGAVACVSEGTESPPAAFIEPRYDAERVTEASASDTPRVSLTPQLDEGGVVHVVSSMDGTSQPSFVRVPTGIPEGQLRPVVIWLHTWRGTHRQRYGLLEERTADAGWVYLAPNFRGPNDDPQACGSALARADILDALDWLIEAYPVDPQRVYVMGLSGGAHMALMMASFHPERFAAVSAWVPMTDLEAWHELHADSGYGEEIRACTGGWPGDGPAVDQEYFDRSPIHHLAGSAGLPVDILAGRDDGHDGNSVPIHHSLDAFNVIAQAWGAPTVTPKEIAQLSQYGGTLSAPKPGDEGEDPDLERAYFLRRTAGPSRVTIFDGGHESLSAAAMAWFEEH